jgi:hypothetical protein
MDVISLAPNHRSFFVRCDPDTTAFAPNLNISFCVCDFCYFHCFFRFPLAYPASFENARWPPPCNPLGVCIPPPGRSTQVFPSTQVALLSFLRSGQERTKSARGTSGSERSDTIACRLWAIEKYSTTSLPSEMSAALAVAGRYRVDSVMFHDCDSLLHPASILIPDCIRRNNGPCPF